MPVSEKEIHQVLHDEALEIKKRREVHGSDQQPSDSDVDAHHRLSPIKDSLTGLALSGGGVRAAAFSLGFIQAMCTAGRMKAFDYLSTVSGGGYAGVHFSATVAKQKGKINWERGGKYNRLDLEPHTDGSQSDTVKRMSLYGRMMGDFIRLFSRHLWGFLVNVTIAISGLVAIASFLAYLMRIPWGRNMLPTINELGFQNDIAISLFIPFIALLVWLASHLLDQATKALGRPCFSYTQYAYLLLLSSLILSVLEMFALGDLSLGNLFGGAAKNAELESRINQLTNWLSVGVSGLLATALLPYLSPRRLLESGKPGASRVETIVFRIAGNALAIGLPLFVFYFLVLENISGFNSGRPDADMLTRAHLSSPHRFATRLQSHATSSAVERSRLARQIYRALNNNETYTKASFDNSTVSITNELEKLRALSEEKKVNDSRHGFITRWLQYIAGVVMLDDSFQSRVDARELAGEYHDEITAYFNERVLSDPALLVTSQSPTIGGEGTGSTTNDSLTAYGLTSSKTRNSRDKRLREAIEELKATRRQWEVRYGRAIKFSYSDQADGQEGQSLKKDHWMLALMSLVAGEMASNPQPELIIPPLGVQEGEQSSPGVKTYSFSMPTTNASQATGQQITGKQPIISGEFVSKLDKLLEDDEGSLRRRIESKLGSMELPHKLDDEEQAFKRWKSEHAAAVGELAHAVRVNNWYVLSQLYPSYIRERETVFAWTVNAADQTFRLNLAFGASAVFLVVGLLTNLNSTSLHGVYRDQLSSTWLPDAETPLHDLETCSKGGPLHLINATVNRMGSRHDPDIERQSRFLLSNLYCGTNKAGYRDTKDYESGSLTVADAIAISGGAVTSVNSPTMLHQLVLFMTNFRLGQWLLNPQEHVRDNYWPSPLRALVNLLWRPEQRSYLFISDGGHCDNTGVAALLQRRCRLIVSVDASFDPNYEFADLLSLLHSARAKYGIRVEAHDFDGKNVVTSNILDQLRPDDNDLSNFHFVMFRIRYPDREDPALLVYCKLTVTGEEPIEIVERTRAKGAFPHDPTTDQFLPPETFESYLVLGRHIGDALDQDVSQGIIDAFNFGQGWHGEVTTQGDSAGLLQSASTEAQKKTADPKHYQNVARSLLQTEFDEQGVLYVTLMLNDWSKTALTLGGQPISESELSTLDLISAWARERGQGQSRKLRTLFCRELLRHIKEHESDVRANEDVCNHYRNLLDVLGHGVPNVRKALNSLTSSPMKAGAQPLDEVATLSRGSTP